MTHSPLAYFSLGWAISETGRALGTEGIDYYQFLFENVAVKEQQCVKRLVLSGSSCTCPSQAGQKCLHFSFGWLVRRQFGGLKKRAIAFDPMNIGFLGLEREMFVHASISHRIDCVLDLHWLIWRLGSWNARRTAVARHSKVDFEGGMRPSCLYEKG